MAIEWMYVGLLAGGLTGTSFLPQIVRGLRTRRLGDVSPATVAVMAAGLALWLAYGLALGDVAIIAANVVGLACTLSLGALWWRYGRSPVTTPPPA